MIIRLPAIEDKINLSISETTLQLAALPPIEAHPLRHVERLVNSLEKQILDAFDLKCSTMKEIKESVLNLSEELNRLAPKIRAIPDWDDEQKEVEKLRCQSALSFGKKRIGSGAGGGKAREGVGAGSPGTGGLVSRRAPPQQQQQEMEDDVMDLDPPSSAPAGPSTPKKRPSNVMNLETPSKSAKRARGMMDSSRPSLLPPRYDLYSNIPSDPNSYTLPYLNHIIKLTNPSLLPSTVDQSATEHLARTSITNWSTPLTSLTNRIDKLIRATFSHTFTSTLSRYDKTPFYNLIKGAILEILEAALERQNTLFQRLLDVEKEYIVTSHKEDFDRLKALHLTALQKRRKRNLEDQKESEKEKTSRARDRDRDNESPLPSPHPTPTKSGRGAAGKGRLSNTAAAAAKLPPTEPKVVMLDDVVLDPYVQALETLASSKAYYDLARKRFVDNVYQSLLSELLRICRCEVVKHVRKVLELDGEDAELRCKKWLEFDEEVERVRGELERRMQKLARGQEELGKFKKEVEGNGEGGPGAGREGEI